MEKEGWKIVAIGVGIFCLLIIIGITVGWVVSNSSLKGELKDTEKECSADVLELRKEKENDMEKQKQVYEEKIRALEAEMKSATQLARTEFVNLESKYGTERVKTKKMSDELFIIRQKLRNLNLSLRSSVSNSQRTIDSNYGTNWGLYSR
jgi:hypothetical protein